MATATTVYDLIKPQVSDDVRPDEDISTLADQVEETLLTCYGVVRRGRRESDATCTGTERGVLRLDNVELKGGIFYTFETNSLEMQTFSGETGKAMFRVSTSGAATIASAEIGSGQGNANTSFWPRQSPTVVAEYAPSSDVTVSILLSLNRTGGSNNVILKGSTSQPITVYVKAWGADPGDTGVDIAP